MFDTPHKNYLYYELIAPTLANLEYADVADSHSRDPPGPIVEGVLLLAREILSADAYQLLPVSASLARLAQLECDDYF